MTDAFSRCHPVLNFFYFAVVLGFTMFIQHPVYLAVSFVAATAYSMWLNGVKKVLKINFLLTLPSLLIVALFNHEHIVVEKKQDNADRFQIKCYF